MFAVPGWSVQSSALKTQTAPAKPVQNGAAPAKDGEQGGDSKKRKRSSGKSQMKDVNKDNLSDMWESVIEGKPKPKKSKKEGKKEHKSAEIEAPDAAQDGAVDLEVEVAPKSTKPEQGAREGKSKKDKKRDKKAKEASAAVDSEINETAAPVAASKPSSAAPAPAAAPPKLTPLQASMRQKLISARFRHLNQTLYTTPSANSLSLFKENPEMFDEYHEGFRRQVEVWPENPVDGYIATIKARGKIRGPARGKPGKNGSEKDDDKEDSQGGSQLLPLPRTSGTCTIADLGCGDAALSTSLQPIVNKLHLKIHSFDLHSPSKLVTKADIANLPLPDSSVDIAIFCLALMGTNWIDFIEEAFRILRWKGELWIAEIKSRFGRVGGGGSKVVEHSVGHRQKKNQPESKEARKASAKKEQEFDDALAAVEVDGHARAEETDVTAFIEVLRKRGFVLKGDGGINANANAEGVDLRNKMFVKMAFVKGAAPVKGKGVPPPKSGAGGSNSGGGGGGEDGATWKRKQKGKFLDNDDDGGGNGRGKGRDADETKVLKPCVYKLR